MRALILGCAVLVVAACSASQTVTSGRSEWPFPVARGSAIAPPEAGGSSRSAPPEGAGPGGIDFGQWRSADPAVYQPAFQTQMRQRYANQEVSYIRADLERNGFSCSGGTDALQCRIEIMERQCALDWYVVVERRNAPPVAGFDRMCLGAR